MRCRKALYNIGRKTVAKYKDDLCHMAAVPGLPEQDNRNVVAARTTVMAELDRLERMLPRAAALSLNTLYDACMSTQSACMAARHVMERIVERLPSMRAGRL